ncbi:MAG TPA: CCA tRNA nucleotidyltransferase [Candidatus Binataceae bacterium]|jgi:poly(A) polymerase|nr:CCA tRNA nucleotidyltransferase [Candidatus Binataceae bacterium]
MSAVKEQKAIAIIARLRERGFNAYLAGGCVRDRVLGVPAQDYDIATDARPEVVQELFDNTVAVGARFGVIMVVDGDDSFEVATFRADLPYLDGRRPSAVRFGVIEEDARRRDFTIGGMYYDPIEERVIDLVGGMRDLRAGVIRAIGDPAERFAEDHLRVLRGVRFAARLGFEIEPATWRAMRRAAPKVAGIAAERVGEEFVMIMTGGHAARGLDLLRDSGLLEVVMPEILPMIGCAQPENFHPEGDVYRHTRLALSMLEPGCSETLAFGVLLHDVAKPQTRAEANGKVTFYGHTEQGAETAAGIMRRMRRSRFVQERVAYLVRNHLRLCMAPRMRPSTLKRMLAEDGFGELLELARLDALASSSYLGFYHFCARALAELGHEEIRPPRLVSGDDLIAMGFAPGPQFKTILKDVEDQQLDGALGSRDEALDYVRQRYGATARQAD